MGRSLEKLAGEEPRRLEGEDSGDDDDTASRSWLAEMWISCTPVVLWEWFRHRREQDNSSSVAPDLDDGARRDERISMSTLDARDPPTPAEAVNPLSEMGQTKGEGTLKILETEIDQSSRENSERGGHGDDIERIPP